MFLEFLGKSISRGFRGLNSLEVPMGKKLYVGNLPYSIDDSRLQSAFAEFGAVASAKVITDRETGRSKGFGFVEMDSDSDAEAAIQKLNGAEMDGRAINVSEARPQEPREGGGGRGGGFGGGGGRGGGGGGRGGFGGGGRGGGGGGRY
jgi:RNA recognition motif-containing protein